ncbi:MAG: hypothetical protein KVP17_004422 [Porospora cf. gigantea B]|uniref:uncharacterized protein n=1 Tax=Porospora cf. gigantea B TaxID=2853592 RepID=UPI003571C18E|nr:MAG: hypothetical protein KVP17_004422 [Porospora cf. gigantea B]
MSTEKEFEGRISHAAIVDGSVAVAETAHVCVDGAFIYPITPSSAASEHFESLSAQRKLNAFGNVSSVRQLQQAPVSALFPVFSVSALSEAGGQALRFSATSPT